MSTSALAQTCSPERYAGNESGESDRLDRSLCHLVYKTECESLFDTGNIQKYRHPKRFYSHQLYKLECFIEDLISDIEKTPFMPRISRGGRKEYDFTKLAETYFCLIPDFIDVVNILSQRYDYNEHITLFTSCCNAMGLLDKKLDWRNVWMSPSIVYPEFGGVTAADLFNRLVSDINSRYTSEGVKSRIRTRRNDANEEFNDYCLYENSMFEVCANLVVLRIDLCYKKEFSNAIDVYGVINDLNHLIKNKRCNSIFKHMVGYIAKIEYAVEKNVHIHAIFFFDGSKRLRTSHAHFAKQIGEYWVGTITKGRGDYWNSNARIKDFMKLGICGIGPVHANDIKTRQNLRNNVIRYLCKSDQFFRPKTRPRTKLIRRGNYPKKPLVKLGRPRDILTADFSASD